MQVAQNSRNHKFHVIIHKRGNHFSEEKNTLPQL